MELWGVLCINPVWWEFWRIWRKCAGRCNNAGCEVQYWTTEPPSTPTHSALAPVSYVAVRVENNEAAVKNRREASFLPSQIAHQETQNITRIEMEVHGNEARLRTQIAWTHHNLLVQIDLNNQGKRGEGLGPEIEVTAEWEPHWHKYR